MRASRAAADIEITGLTAASAAVKSGNLFAALKGARADGVDHIPEALRRGAAALLVAGDALHRIADPDVPVVTDANPRRRFALMAARFYSEQPAVMAAVTGTNGKSSVAGFTRQLWARLGRRAASLGTLGVESPLDQVEGPPLTTPDPVALHRMLAELAAGGIDHAAIEASSHGLDQHRLDGVRLRAAAFTNLTRDHLDYHRDAAAYLAAKMRLFTEILPADGVAVLNADIPEFESLAAACRQRGQQVLAYGHGRAGRRPELRIVGRVHAGAGQRMTLSVAGRVHTVETSLVGDFQAMNILCAIGLVVACGGDRDAAVAAVPALRGIAGRLERVATHPSGGAVFVDYAHTPDALAAVLRALRPATAGRLAVVFGCGGDRDPGKRPLMGEIAARLADRVIVTDDNPRSEDPAAIRAAILAACPGAEDIGDRRQAIAAGVTGLEAGDALVIAGKGHEQGQEIRGRKVPFDDAAAARAAVAALAGEAS